MASLGGIAQQQLGNGALLLSGGLGLPGGVASTIGARRGNVVRLVGNGHVRSERVGAVISSEAVKVLAGCPVAVALLPVAQRLAGRPGRVTELLIEPRRGQEALVASELRRVARGRLDVEPADNEIRLLTQATKPNRQSTSLFSAISVMVGFLLALNAMLLTVPERRRFVAELRMQGYDPRQILMLLSFQAVMLGLVASLAGVALGDLLSRTVYGQVPAYLSVAFPVSAEHTLHTSVILLAIGCGVLATLLASLSPVFDLRPGRPADAIFREAESGGELIRASTSRLGVISGIALLALVGALVALAPGLTILGGVALAVATLCLMPAVLAAIVSWLPRLTERSRSGAVIVAVSELRATTTRSVALAAIVGLAVYGSVAIGGARDDLLRGIETATAQYHSTANIWVTTGNDVFNTNGFPTDGSPARIARVPGVRSVRVYQGGLTDIGSRRLWVRARAAKRSRDVRIESAAQWPLRARRRLDPAGRLGRYLERPGLRTPLEGRGPVRTPHPHGDCQTAGRRDHHKLGMAGGHRHAQQRGLQPVVGYDRSDGARGGSANGHPTRGRGARDPRHAWLLGGLVGSDER